MSPKPTISEAQLVSLFVESTFFGIYLVSFIACMRILLSNDFRHINKSLVIAAVLMFVFASFSVILQLVHLLNAFIWYRGPGGPIGELTDISYWVNVMKTVCYTFQTFIADLILIYRCFIVYGRSWLVIALPFLVWVGTLVSGCIVIYITASLRISANLDEKHLVPFITSTLGLTLVQNVATVALIAYRIWSHGRRVSMYRMSPAEPLRRVIKVILETGLIYTVALTIFIITFLSSNNAQYIIADAVIQIIGIVFNVIILRLHQGRSASQQDTGLSGRIGDLPTSASLPVSVGQSSGANSGSPESGAAGKRTSRPEFHAMKSMEVKIDFESHTRHDELDSA